MSAFPQYDAALLDQLDTQTAAILGVFAKQNYARIEPPHLDPTVLLANLKRGLGRGGGSALFPFRCKHRAQRGNVGSLGLFWNRGGILGCF